MIDFTIPDETEMLLATVRRFICEELRPHEDEVEHTGTISTELAAELRTKAKALGLFAMTMPEEVGGAGLSTVDACLCEEEFGVTKDALVRRAFGNIPRSLLNASDAQREQYLLPAVRGDIIVAVALTEPEAGSDAAGIRTHARRAGGDYVLDGAKHFISDAEVADAFIVTAVTDPDAASKGISTFLVDRDAPGLSIGRRQPMMGMRGTTHAEVVLEGVRLPASQMLGPEGSGLFQALSHINGVRLGKVGARSVGMARHVLALAVEHAKTRAQFGKPLCRHQMIQAMVADMATEIYAAHTMVLDTAWEIDQGRDPRDKVSMVKLFASEMLGRAADKAVQIFGGAGYCQDLPIERFFRDARVYRIFDGTSEIHRLVVAKHLFR